MNAPDVNILSVGTALPGPPVDNAALAGMFRMSPQWATWVDTFVGTRTRHLGVDPATGAALCSLADLGTEAGGTALARAGLEPGDIDFVVLATAMPDTLIPTTVNTVADRLKIDGVPTYQLQSGCAGVFQALEFATRVLAGGTARTGLVIGGDRVTKHLDLGVDFGAIPPAELVSLVMFGDGVGAAVLSTRPAPEATAIRHVFTRLTGLDRSPGHVVEWFGLADLPGIVDPDRPAVPPAASSEDYKAIEESVPAMSAEILDELLDGLDWKAGDFDYLLPPQLSGRMTERIVERLAVPDAHEVSCVRDTGNVGNATPFFQLERLLPMMLPGDRALGVSVESSKWIKAGLALERVAA
jgi:3-oxoacyl-[acyl-carrier-protein] synthase-3